MSEEMLAMLMQRYRVPRERRYRVTGPLDLNKLMMSVYGQLDRPDLKYRRAEPVAVPALSGKDVFEQITARDWLYISPLP